MKENIRSRVPDLALCALFAGLMAVLSQIVIPIQPVPISLGSLGVLLAGGLLGAKRGFAAIACYVLMGIIGLPVFAGWKTGAQAFAGPTAGFILGYLAAVLVVGLIAGSTKKLPRIILGMIAGAAVYFVFGTIVFKLRTGADWAGAFSLCVIPFLIGDTAKIILASLAVRGIRGRGLGIAGKE